MTIKQIVLTVSIELVGVGLVLLLVGCSRTTTQPSTPTSSPELKFTGTIVAVGDSLTEGYGVERTAAYPALLEQKLQADGHLYRVVNAGISGETSSGTLSRLNWILRLKPDIVILETGGNDGLRAIDPILTRQNLNAIIDHFQENEIEVVLAGMQTIQNLGQEYTEAYSAIYPRVAKEQDVILIPFFLKGVAAKPELNQPDGIHPTAAGYQIVVDTVYPYVLEAIEKHEAEH